MDPGCERKNPESLNSPAKYVYPYLVDVYPPVDDEFVNVFIDPNNCANVATYLDRINRDSEFLSLKQQYNTIVDRYNDISNTYNAELITNMEDLIEKVENRITELDKFYGYYIPEIPRIGMYSYPYVAGNYVDINDDFINVFINEENENIPSTHLDYIKNDPEFNELVDQYKEVKSNLNNIENMVHDDVLDIEYKLFKILQKIEDKIEDLNINPPQPPPPTTEGGKKRKKRRTKRRPKRRTNQTTKRRSKRRIKKTTKRRTNIR